MNQEVNVLNDRNEFTESREIDLVDFSANSEMQRIRENERIEREKRMKRAAELRKAEILKKKKIARIKQTVTAWAILIAAVVAVIAVISGVVSLFNKKEPVVLQDVGDRVSEKEVKLVESFAQSESIVYGKDKQKSLDGMVKDLIVSPTGQENFVTLTSEYGMLSDAYSWNEGFGARDALKNYVLSCPVFSNGYIWSSQKSMKSPITNDGYLYDTNASFINAVYDICLWEGDTSFLGELDTSSEAKGDVSGGKTVREKLDAVVSYYFNDKDINGGGIRYGFKYVVENGVLDVEKTDDGLVYICTSDNLGTPQSHASNVFSTYKFGYLDCYNNLVFNDAMNSLSKLYALDGNVEKSEYFASIAKANKEAINATFWDNEKGRYIGYIDADGTKYDSGFTAVNLLAVSLGVADEDKTESIMSWISGERKISSDDLDSKEIVSGALVAFSTVSANDSTFDNLSGKYLLSGNASFGNNWLNGGKSALSSAMYIDAIKSGKDGVSGFVNKIADSYSKGNLKVDTETPEAEPALYYSLLASKAVKEYFGVSTDGKVLTINPLIGTLQDMGIKNIAFSRRLYDVLYDKGDVYLFCNINAPVRVRLGGFEANENVKLTIVDSELVSQTENVKADKDGFVTVSKKFGNTSYIKLETE